MATPGVPKIGGVKPKGVTNNQLTASNPFEVLNQRLQAMGIDLSDVHPFPWMKNPPANVQPPTHALRSQPAADTRLIGPPSPAPEPEPADLTVSVPTPNQYPKPNQKKQGVPTPLTPQGWSSYGLNAALPYIGNLPLEALPTSNKFNVDNMLYDKDPMVREAWMRLPQTWQQDMATWPPGEGRKFLEAYARYYFSGDPREEMNAWRIRWNAQNQRRNYMKSELPRTGGLSGSGEAGWGGVLQT